MRRGLEWAWGYRWPVMLYVNVGVLIGVAAFKLRSPAPIAYIHMLVDYRFGFVRRGLIGSGVALFLDRVPPWAVNVPAVAIWFVTLGLFLAAFRRAFGFSRESLPLLIFIGGSPFFLKNFMHTLGHFDIYGCCAALLLLLVPARSLAYVALAAALSMLLLLIHHIHLLMYLPTIASIVVLRHYLPNGITRANVAIGAVAVVAVLALFGALQFLGEMKIPHDQFVAYLTSRMADPSQTLMIQHAYIWHQSMAREVSDTWSEMSYNLAGVPVYALLIALHAPLWLYFRALIATLPSMQRRVVVTGLATIALGYLVIFATVFDYSRWVSNGVTCLVLILMAVAMMPRTRAVSFDPRGSTATGVLGWLVTLVPRIGVIRPF